MMFVVHTVMAAILPAILLFIRLRRGKAGGKDADRKEMTMTSLGALLKTAVRKIGNKQRLINLK